MYTRHVLWYLARRKAKKDKTAHQNIIGEKTTTKNSTNDMLPSPIPQPINQTITQSVIEKPITKNEDSTEKLKTSQKMAADSLIQLNTALSSGNITKVTMQQSSIPSIAPIPDASYIEDDKIIVRTDGKEITDDEVPYLIQTGYENALERNGGYNGEIIDLSFMQKRERNKKEYTRIPTYEELSTIENNESYVSLAEISFLNYIHGLPLKNPLIAQKWYYDYNLNYTKTIINLISNGLLTVEHACIDKLKIDELKAILKGFNYPTYGKKEELQARIHANISQTDIDNYFNNAKHFSATTKGKELIKCKHINL